MTTNIVQPLYRDVAPDTYREVRAALIARRFNPRYTQPTNAELAAMLNAVDAARVAHSCRCRQHDCQSYRMTAPGPVVVDVPLALSIVTSISFDRDGNVTEIERLLADEEIDPVDVLVKR